MDRDLDMALARLQRTRSKLNPGHSGQQDDDGIENNRESRERFKGKNKIIVFVTSVLNWWLVILKEISEKQTAWRIWHKDLCRAGRQICLAGRDEQEMIWRKEEAGNKDNPW